MASSAVQACFSTGTSGSHRRLRTFPLCQGYAGYDAAHISQQGFMISIKLKKIACRILNVHRAWDLDQYWLPFIHQDRARIEGHQLGALRSLLVHAGKNVPYYRDCFSRLGFNPEVIRSVEELEQLPILTKEIIRKEGIRMLAENFPRKDLQQKSTGGSTGDPLVFYRHREYLSAARMGNFRNLALCGWKPGEPVANFWGVNDPASFRCRAFKEEVNLGLYTFNAFDAGEKKFGEWIERMEAIQPSVIYGYASTIWLFSKWLESAGKAQPAFRNLHGVFLTAEKLHSFQRTQIEKVFQKPVFNLYGSTEIQNIAFECRRGSMHIASDFVIVEKSSHNNGPMPVLLTSLKNYAMPFIRYKNEDEGDLPGYVCDCGIQTPCMSLDISRTCDNFPTLSGRVIHGEFFTHMMAGIRGIRTFQFRQVTPGEVKLRVVADEACSAEDREKVETIGSVVSEKTDGELKVCVEWVAEIPLTDRGKHIFTISEVLVTKAGLV
jgi:phenylacetate-CoA ligase